MVEIIPNWHPIFVHFTVGLLSFSVLLFVLVYVLPDNPWRQSLADTARWNLWGGTGLTLFTVLTGWLAYNSVNHDEISHQAMIEHRLWALFTAGIFLVLALWSFWLTRKSRRLGGVFMILLVLAGGLLASTAWHGAELVYRHGLGVQRLPLTTAAPEVSESGDTQHGANNGPAHDHSDHAH